MPKKEDFRRIFNESFRTDKAWSEWFLREVATDDDQIMMHEADGRGVSTLLMQPYDFAYHGQTLPLAYISCVATAKAYRGKGLMHKLMVTALREAFTKGYALASLIPASRRLFFFYDTFQFATVFYIDELRYTSLHKFDFKEDFAEIPPSYDDFKTLESCRKTSIRHCEQQFGEILKDLELDKGFVKAVGDADGNVAMAFVRIKGSEAHIIDLQYTTESAAEAVLSLVRDKIGEKSIIVHGEPAGRRAALRGRGMARIINVELLLSALAEKYPNISQTFRIHDPIIKENNGLFSLKKGLCTKVAEEAKPDLDVSVDVLAKILFSSEKTGKIFNLPTTRPFQALMLE